MMMFLFGFISAFFVGFIFSVLAINPREDEFRTQKARGDQNHEVWKKEER